jgi:small subunit ribosomal protein S6
MAAKYETIIVFKPDLNEAQVKEEGKKVETLLKNEGAIEVATETWGRKDLAYPVHKCKAGTYVCFKYTSDTSDTVKNVTSVLRISEPVIKFQTHRIAEKVRKFKGNPRRTGTADGEEFIEGVEDNF